VVIYPSKREIMVELKEENNYMIGGEIYNLVNANKYTITRLTTNMPTNTVSTNILVKCIDDNSDNQLGLFMVEDKKKYIRDTSRTYATLVIHPTIEKNVQKELVERFNEFLGNYRAKYNSLFLTNYRESKDIARKRIPFTLVYIIVAHILYNLTS
jgi:hypothetical protein